ncbi:hypothetical protein [Chitinophaga japonensis]|uniref:hypothetical protein n=1 Tax=Chitinophaga japonensis TaxID=104662 RepID=UPI0011A02926|nr:hypothetical protein [Chitinophaga japonensis]
MPVLQNIRSTKLTAFVLLVLMPGIHGVKLFHHHPTPVLTKHASPGRSALAVHPPVHHCVICDFQPAKAAGVAIVQFCFQPLQPAVAWYAHYPAAYTTIRSPHVWLRGPPVIA